MDKKISNITSTTIEDDTDYQSTLAFILLTDVVDGSSIYEDFGSLTNEEFDDKIMNAIRYTFRRRVLDELYGAEIGSGYLKEKPDELSDKKWEAVIKRSEIKWEEYRKYTYPFEMDKCKGFFASDKGAEVDMFYKFEEKVFIHTKDGRKIPLSKGGLLHWIDRTFEIEKRPGVLLTTRMKKTSFEEHTRRAERDLYEK